MQRRNCVLTPASRRLQKLSRALVVTTYLSVLCKWHYRRYALLFMIITAERFSLLFPPRSPSSPFINVHRIRQHLFVLSLFYAARWFNYKRNKQLCSLIVLDFNYIVNWIVTEFISSVSLLNSNAFSNIPYGFGVCKRAFNSVPVINFHFQLKLIL